MFVKLLGVKGTWREVANAARTTIHMEEGTKEPSSIWKRRILLAEHSPMEQLLVKCKWYDEILGVCSLCKTQVWYRALGSYSTQ